MGDGHENMEDHRPCSKWTGYRQHYQLLLHSQIQKVKPKQNFEVSGCSKFTTELDKFKGCQKIVRVARTLVSIPS